MSRYIREAFAVVGLSLAIGFAGPAFAFPGTHFIFGDVTALPSGSPVGGAHVEAVGVLDGSGKPVADDTDIQIGYSLFSVPDGEVVLRVSGNCLDTTDEVVTLDPAVSGIQHDIAVSNASVPGVGDCLPFQHTPLFDPTFWERMVLHHRFTLSNKKPFSLSLPFPVRFGNTNYRRVWVTANGWISFIKPGAPCTDLTPTSAPPSSIFALAQCGETKEARFEILDQKPHRVMVLRWNLVTPDTAQTSDVAIRFFEDRPSDIGVSYVHLGGPADGSNGFIGFSTKSGGIFTLGDHEAVVNDQSSLIFRPGL